MTDSVLPLCSTASEERAARFIQRGLWRVKNDDMSSIQARSPLQRSIAWCLAFAAWGMGVGVSSTPPTWKDRRVAFPCESHACGCADAAMCWSRCSCYSEGEKLAWAASRGVSPPAWFRPTRVGNSSGSPTLSGRKSRPCCAACDSSETRAGPSADLELPRVRGSDGVDVGAREATGEESGPPVVDACRCTRPSSFIASFAPAIKTEATVEPTPWDLGRDHGHVGRLICLSTRLNLPILRRGALPPLSESSEVSFL